MIAFAVSVRKRLGWLKRAMLGGPETRRAAYARVWDDQAQTEDAAKIAVAGYTDEVTLARTAAATLQLLQDTVGIAPQDAILEIGCGVGRVGRVLAPHCREWVGADVSANMLAHMRRRLADLANIRAVRLNGYDLTGIPDAAFDVVYCTVVFMHLDEWERYRYIRDAFRVLRPGGRLYVDNVNLLSNEGWEHFEQHLALDPMKRPAWTGRTSTPQELAEYFRRAGFAGIQQTTTGLWIVTWGAKPSHA